MNAEVREVLEADVRMTQERFCAAMESRLATLEAESLERYFVVLSKLVAKLEDVEKSLAQIVSEMMAEAAGVVMAELRARHG